MLGRIVIVVCLLAAGVATVWLVAGSGAEPGSEPSVEGEAPSERHPAPDAASTVAPSVGRKRAPPATPAPTAAAPGDGVFGRVIDERARPLAGATVRVIRLEIGPPPVEDVRSEGESDAAGRFALAGGAPWVVEATAADRARLRVFAPQSGPVELQLGPPGSLAGTVAFDRDLGPCVGAYVVVQPGTRAPWRYTRTDERGRYRFADLPAANYRVLIYPRDFPPETAVDIRVAAGDTTPLDFEISSGVAMKGTITDAKTGAPIAGVEVIASHSKYARRATSSDMGFYRLKGLLPGHRMVGFKAKEYHPAMRMIRVDEADHSGTIVENIALVRPITLRGIVVDPSGRPVPHAKVASGWHVLSGGDVRVREGTVVATDEAGRFALTPRLMSTRSGVRLPRRLFAIGDGFAPGRALVPETESGEAGDVVIRLGAGGRIVGRVENEYGRPLSNAHLTLDRIGEEAQFGRAFGSLVRLAEQDGTFALESVTPGSYELRAAWGQMRETVKGIDVREGATSGEHVVVLRMHGVIAGLVRDAAGTPIAGAGVWAYLPGGPPASRPRGTSRTDGNGAFRIENLREASYHIEGYYRGFEKAERDGVAAGTTDLAIVLRRVFPFTGRVQREDGTPPENAIVRACREGKGGAGHSSVAAARADGRFELAQRRSLPRTGRFTLHATGDAGRVSDPVEVRLVAGVRPRPVTLVLRTGAVLEGLVKDPDGAPVMNASVFIHHESGRALAAVGGVKTTSKGAFRLQGLLPGTFLVVAKHSRFVDAEERVTLRRGKRARVVLALEAEGGRVAVVVTDADGNPVAGARVLFRRQGRVVWPSLYLEKRRREALAKADPRSRARKAGEGLPFGWGGSYTDPAGRLVRRFLPPGAYEVEVSRTGFAPGRVAVWVAAGALATTAVELERQQAKK